MIAIAIGAVLALAAMAWVIAPILGEGRGGAAGAPQPPGVDDAAEAAVRRVRERGP